MKRVAKKVRINLRVSDEKAAWIEGFAKRIGTNTTGVIEHLIEEGMLKDHDVKNAPASIRKNRLSVDAPVGAKDGGGNVIKSA